MVLSATDKVSKSGGNLSPVPCFDRSDSVTPTNELIDEEASLTPKSVSPLGGILYMYIYKFLCKFICIYMHVYSTVAKRKKRPATLYM